MRLLQRLGADNFRLTDKLDKAKIIPAYAILSHTWGAEEDEVTFEDLLKGDDVYKRKLGYEKIRFCGEQAWQDGLQYFWIDTGCINRTHKAELSHAIKSMFRWYQNAARCYVYLTDVSAHHASSNDAYPWEVAFRNSRWFTRGWTLQELIAPTTVEFYSNEKERLGDRSSLIQQIHEITGIPHAALQSTPLSQFSVEERLSWRKERKTKRNEDGAYSMSGLLDVHLAPVYDEGANVAFARLHDEIRKNHNCIRDLRLTDPRDDKRRIEDTKGGLLQDSYRWILDNTSFQQWQNEPSSQLLWIKGDPGRGKTMLLCGIINELQKSSNGALISYVFCQATDSRINSATNVLRGLLHLLIIQQPWLIYHVRTKYDEADTKALFEDANAWFVLTEIFSQLLKDSDLPPIYLVIDALDECTIDLTKFLVFIVEQSSASPHVKWLVSSRNISTIEEKLKLVVNKVRIDLELNTESVAAAVANFIERKVSQLAEQKRYTETLRNTVLRRLTSDANDTFLWAALVCEELQTTSTWNVLKKLESFPPGLDALYRRMILQISESDDDEVCKWILATTALVHRPLALEELAVLVK